MKRLFWLGAGLAVGALVFRAVSKRAQAYTPRGLAGAARESGRNVLDSVRDFVDDVRDGMREREDQLHAALRAGADTGTGGDGDDGWHTGTPPEGTAR
jgi:hypothetical protein